MEEDSQEQGERTRKRVRTVKTVEPVTVRKREAVESEESSPAVESTPTTDKGSQPEKTPQTPKAENTSSSTDFDNVIVTHYGKMVNLTNTTITQAYNALNSIDLLFLGVKEQYAFTEIYPEKGSPVQSYFSVSGLGKDSGAKEITLLVGDGTQIIKSGARGTSYQYGCC